MNVSQFERACSLSNNYVKRVSDVIGSDKLACILSTFPKLSADWLILGEGPMLRQTATQTFQNSNMSGNKLGNFSSLHANDAQGLKIISDQLDRKDDQINELIAHGREQTALMQQILALRHSSQCDSSVPNDPK